MLLVQMARGPHLETVDERHVVDWGRLLRERTAFELIHQALICAMLYILGGVGIGCDIRRSAHGCATYLTGPTIF